MASGTGRAIPSARVPRRLTRPSATLVAAVVLMAASACGNGDDAPEEDAGATTTVDSTTTTTQLTPEEEAEAVYLELFDTVMRLLTTDPNPDDPDLARLAMDPVLSDIQDNLTTMKAENHIVERGPRTSQRVMSISISEPGGALLRACSVGNDTRIDQDDGTIIDEGLSTRVLEATMQLDGDMWRVSEIATVERFDGEAPCPE